MKRIRIIVMVASIVAVLAALPAGVYYFLPESPGNYMREARNELSKARKARAESFAPSRFRQAEAYYDSAHLHWSEQNRKWILARDFENTMKNAMLSAELARKAAEESRRKEKDLRADLEARAGKLENEMNLFSDVYGKMPLKNDEMNEFNLGKMKLTEARHAISSGDLFGASDALGMASGHLRFARESADDRIRDYFSGLPAWREMVANTIKISVREGIPVIIVDKYGGICQIYVAGKKKGEFMIEMGPNWMGDKNFRGDLATPEGIYKVTRKKEGGQTKYYKALLINYPNTEDEKRFRDNLKNGDLPSNAMIGGLIEIHGEGGKGMHWTKGCIALSNEDMDRLYDLVSVGTPVTIVGSLVEFNDGI